VKTWEYVSAGAICLGVFMGLGLFFNDCFESAVQRDCLNTGRTVINKTVYACQKVGPEVKP